MAEEKKVETAEDLLRWCYEHDVVPQPLDDETALSDAGCGCCAVDVELTDDVIKAFKRFIPH